MKPHPAFPGAFAVALSVISWMSASAAIVDRTQLLFSAPAYIFGNPDPVPMNHAHLIYLGADTSDPSAVGVDYSFSLMDTGELGFLSGFIDGIYVDVERPPAHLVPPYHLIGLAVSGAEGGPGGLLIGLGPVGLYHGETFSSAFPGIVQEDVVSQLRSGNLSGGAVEALVSQLVLDQATLQSPIPMPVPEGSPGLTGTVLGFSDSGDPVDLVGVAGPDDFFPEWTVFHPEFSMYPLDPVILPESRTSTGALAGFSILLGWQALRKRRHRDERAGDES